MLINTQRMMTAILLLVSLMGLNACSGGSSGDDEFKEAVIVNDLKITSIEVSSDNDIVETGVTERYRAIAEIDSGPTTMDVTDRVHWSSSNTSIVSISASGVATTVADGVVEIRAEIADLFDTKDLNSSGAVLDSIDITTDMPATVGVCTHGYKLVANGNYDGESTPRIITSIVEWTSNASAVAEVGVETGSEGEVATLKGGNASFTATRNSKSDTVDLVVDRDLLTSIAVTPNSGVSLFIGGDQQFTAMGTYSDLAEPADITLTVDWDANNSDGGTSGEHLEMSTQGLGEGISEGASEVTASCGGDPNADPVVEPAATSVAVAVTVKVPVTLTDIEINDDDETVLADLADLTVQLKAELVYSDGSSTQDVTNDSDTIWTIKSGAATVSSSSGSKGKVSFTETGSSEVKVSYTDSDGKVVSDTIDVDIN